MRVEQISNLEALAGVLVLAGIAALLFFLVPPAGPADRPRRFADAEIVRHDAALPKYLLTTALALALGAIHLAVKSIPSIALWLEQGGRGGHLVANVAYSHMVIVLGGTIAVTGLTWYALPRILRRPLYSDTLAHLAYWGTVLGAGGFYLANIAGGLVMASLVHAGLTDTAADDAVGMWRTLPTAVSAGVMGAGYWLFVVNVLVTWWLGRRVATPQPQRHLAKFFGLGAIGLFVGTVHGVLQVMPDNEAWLAAAGAAGRYIDPIAHAHVNLITGVLMLVVGLALFLSQEPDAAPARRRGPEVVFWALGGGSLALYVTFLALGFNEGAAIIEQNITFPEAVRQMGLWHIVPLLASGGAVLAGFWLFVAILARRLLTGLARQPGAVLVAIGAAVLVVGTAQGGIQMLPAVKLWLVEAEAAGRAVARAHAQFNMLGGILTMLIGLALLAGPAMLGLAGREAPAAVHRLGFRLAGLLGAGAGLYYAATLAGALVTGQAVRAGATWREAFAAVQPWSAPATIAGALLYALGALWLFQFAWRASATYRAAAWRALLRELDRHNSEGAAWQRRMPNAYSLLPEAATAIFGFPGLGWIIAGKALIGVPLMFAGPAIAWAFLPLLISPYSDVGRADGGPMLIQIYLIVSAVLSVSALWLALRWRRAH